MRASTTIAQLKDAVGQEVTLCGWLYRGRASGKVQFLILRDGTGLCQCVVEKGQIPDAQFDELKHLGQESSLSLTGTVRAEQRSVGGHELAVTGATIVGPRAGESIAEMTDARLIRLRGRPAATAGGPRRKP